MRLDDLYDVGAQDGPERVSDRVLTVPNVLSLLRLVALPVLWADITGGRFVRALVVLGIFASTDWIDGYVARRFDQVSRIGKVLDPAADRLLIVVVAVACVVGDVMPWWTVAVVLVRDAVVGGIGLTLLARGQQPPPVSRLGKTATFQLLFGFPLLLLGEALEGTGATIATGLGWFSYACGAVLYWVAAWDYRGVMAARLRAGAQDGPDGGGDAPVRDPDDGSGGGAAG